MSRQPSNYKLGYRGAWHVCIYPIVRDPEGPGPVQMVAQMPSRFQAVLLTVSPYQRTGSYYYYLLILSKEVVV